MTKEALTAERIARRKKYPAPEWADHNLRGEHRRTTAKSYNARTLSVRELAALRQVA